MESVCSCRGLGEVDDAVHQLIGRDRELEVLERLLGDARAFRRAVDELVQPWAG